MEYTVCHLSNMSEEGKYSVSFPYDDKECSVLDDIGHLLDHFYRKQKHAALTERQTSVKVI